MRKSILIIGLLYAVAFPLCAQNWTPQDSLKLQQLLKGNGEVKVNPDALKELERNILGAPEVSVNKSWMDFDPTLPTSLQKEPKQEIKLTLRPYTANTKYNWDPVYQKKINVGKNTWRGDPYYELKTLFIYTNWAKTPLDIGPRESVEQIEATGQRYRVTERANNMAVGSWQGVGGGGIGSLDLMTPFTREFWNFKGRRRRARTLEVLKAYGDSTTVLIKHPVKELK
ncbi:DUF4858 domain-containing protein [Bacteroides fluxus]|uniref:DUF4858 domain-containing protein n=1 Tax=Bacteroides fluxus TaxID=626930 RepID=UPI002A829E0F|nr:DUF4858 domain-containing protein [Bacteroides fluxus]MDY3788913.1 DUF4858 domain-containing protein [Bacteroides fluxus]